MSFFVAVYGLWLIAAKAAGWQQKSNECDWGKELRLKKGDICQGVVERVDFPNKGILHVDDRTCIVKNALPGQTISFRVGKIRKGKVEGSLLEIVEPAVNERPDLCPHFGRCGGCTYLSLPYEEQLRIKEEQVKRLLSEPLKAQEQEMAWEGILCGESPYAYRNKMEFTFGDEYKDGPLALGMHRRGSFYDVVTVSGCQIVDEDYRRILTATLSFFRERGISYYHRLRHEGALRHLLVRKGHFTGEILVALVTSSELAADSPVMTEYRDMLLSLELDGTLQGILHIRNDSVADTVQSDGTTVLFGRDFIYEKLLGLTFKISTFSFFQTNSMGAEVLYSTVRRYVEESGAGSGTVYDLYSGTGTIAQLMAPAASQVIGVEIVEEAVEAAKENAALNGLSNCTFLAGDVLKLLDTIEEKPDLIILDPPRDGVHPKALQKILSYGVEHIVYISCKPTSLARDLEVILASGYSVERGCCVDQFPNSANVETVVQLSQQKPDDVIRVGLDLDELDITAAESKATYQEIKASVKEQTGLSVSSLYIAQVKQKYGIIERENYNLSKSEDARQPQCPPEKEKAIVEALRHFKMIEGSD